MVVGEGVGSGLQQPACATLPTFALGGNLVRAGFGFGLGFGLGFGFGLGLRLGSN